MREANYLEGLIQLHRISDPAERASVWRQSMATLAAAVSDQLRYVPLEGLDPLALSESIRTAVDTGLLEQLGFLSDSARGAALYELASALPAGADKREIGRRVLRSLRMASGEAFVGVATQIALGAPKGLSGAGNRARVALALDLPLGSSARADSLALALISRRGSSIEWLRSPSMGSMPSRRLAARLLERAAREAAHRSRKGDDSGVRIFETADIRAAWDRLLADRESLVWRHVAAARGLLSLARPNLAEEIERHLGEGLGVTEWRRAAASLVASLAVRSDAIGRCRNILNGPLIKKDPGIAAAMIMTIGRAVESEPELATELLEQAVRVGGLAAAEELVELRRELRGGDDFGEWAAKAASASLKDRLNKEALFDDGEVQLLNCVIEELDETREDALDVLIDDAVALFHSSGPVAARASAMVALEYAQQTVSELEEHVADESSNGRRWAFRTLRTIDRSLLASDALANLLSLTSQSEQADESVRPLGDLFQRLTNWLVIHEGYANEEEQAPHFVHRLRRLRTFLHLVDADGRRVDDRADLLRQRRLLSAQILLARVRADKAVALRRALCAAAARACDALVREETCEVSDVLLVAGRVAQSHSDLWTMAEASMVPDLVVALHAYSRLERVAAERDRSLGRAARASLDEVSRLAHELPIATSPRVEALRRALLDLVYALEPLAAAGSLRELAEQAAGDTPLGPLQAATQNLAQLAAGAARRLGEIAVERPESGSALRFVDIHLERAIRGNPEGLSESIDAASETLQSELPAAVAGVVTSTLRLLLDLPMDAARRGRSSFVKAVPKDIALPAWVPPSRIVGGFYLDRPIGAGAVGSVFVARRSEARRDASAEQFALKVPDYSGAAARTLSESEFLTLFGQEAGALLALPAHPNLAGFVTFDARARPKPVLVMELVEGPNLERVIETGDLDMARSLDFLHGIASGLEAMHSVGVAHLDIKPSNIIIRDPDGLAGPMLPDAPVLVDFGLAGRTLRPGCGTASYGAPEVWGHDHSGKGQALPVDTYAFGCLAYELITGRTLFEEANDIATITAHLQHDGMPASVGRMSEDPRTQGIAELIRRAIRRDPVNRVSMGELREALERLRVSNLVELKWPLEV